MKEPNLFDKILVIFLTIVGTLAIIWVSAIAALYMILMLPSTGLHIVLIVIAMLLLPALIPVLYVKKKGRYMKYWSIGLLVFLLACGINTIYNVYDESTVINTAPSIRVDEYLPFTDGSKLVTLDHEASLKLTEDLPRVDGATAVFPVYSAFVQATYPDTTKLYYEYYDDGTINLTNDAFQYNNTVNGYEALAEKRTDIFFGAYPSDEQIAYAEDQGTEFIYTPIGYEAFVFFVHKDNPIDNLTTEQIKAIYSGEITNWSQVGGSFESIAAYQRNQNSGSQSMLIRFMDGTPLAKPPQDMVSGSMGGIAERVADYRNRSNSMGFSFRYYIEGIIQNPDIKLLSIDGVAPTVENIRNGTYPIVAPLYAVTWEGNENENVQLLLDWVLSPEGQYIIEQTGYIPIGPTE